MVRECGARILLSLDQVEGGETKIPVVIRYARMMGAQVVLLHVLPRHALDSNAVLPEEARARAYLARVPLGRMGEPDDIARVALFLASDAAAKHDELVAPCACRSRRAPGWSCSAKMRVARPMC